MSRLLPSQEVLKSTEYEALKQYLSSPNEALGAALDAFCEPVENQYMATSSASDVEDILWKAWRSMIAVAAQTPDENDGHQRLAELIVELRRRPTLEKDGQPCLVQDMTVWRDSPLFGWAMRDAWNEGQYLLLLATFGRADKTTAASDSDDQEAQQAWLNLNAWSAQLVATAHSRSQDQPDMSLYAIWTIRMALEEHDSDSQPPNVSLSAAAAWLANAAPALWDFSKDGKAFDGKVAKPGAEYRDAGWRGFSTDRWQAWKKALSGLQESMSDSGTSLRVERARKAMGDAEGR